jgi:hypothetical protein
MFWRSCGRPSGGRILFDMKKLFTALVSAAAAMLALAGPASIDFMLPSTDTVAAGDVGDAWDW